MVRLGMVIDLKSCIGCEACTVACKMENGSPPGIWHAPVFEREEGKYPSVKTTFLPTLCMHCKDPPCARVCPSGVFYKRDDGIVMLDLDRCIASGSCIEACPYGALQLYERETGYFGGSLTPIEKLFYQRHTPRKIQKCTFCAPRVDKGLNPACVDVCPTKTRYFGDLDDPASEVSRLLSRRNSVALLAEAGTDPSVRYLL